MLSRRRLLGATLAFSALPFTSGAFARAQSPTAGAPVDPELWSYLALSPTTIANLRQALPLTAGNAQLQAESLVIPFPIDTTDPEQQSAWIQGMSTVALPSFLLSRAMQPDFTQLTGFDFGQVASGAEIGEPPNMVTFLRGTFDPAQVQATQLALGYQQRDLAGHTVFSLNETGDFDFTNPVQRMALSRLNNSTILDDGTLVYAPTLDLLEQVLSPDSTLATIPEVARAAQTLDRPLASSVLLGPGAFLPDIARQLLPPQTQDQIAAYILARRNQHVMPIVLTGLAGNTAGGPPREEPGAAPATPFAGERSLSKFALVYATPQDAETAAVQIEQRLASGQSLMAGQPWTELFARWSTTPNPDQASVLVTLEWIDRPANTFTLIAARDLGFITGL